IFPLARRLVRIATSDFLALEIAGLAGHTELVFGTIVERLEIRVGERPIGKRRIFRNRGRPIPLNRLRACTEIVLMQAPGERAVMDGAATRLMTVVLVRRGARLGAGIGPPGDRRLLDVRPQILALEVAQLIELEVSG